MTRGRGLYMWIFGGSVHVDIWGAVYVDEEGFVYVDICPTEANMMEFLSENWE